MINEMRDFVLELVKSEYETGNQLVETKDEFEQLCADEGVRCTNAMWDLYQKYHMEGLDYPATEEVDEIIEEALSNKEKLKRAYPELNFDNPEAEPLTEAVDAEDKMQTAVGILYDMDNFVLSVYDNDYWLTYGVPDGEFDEDDRDLAEANYEEHQWLIEDDDGNFDTEAFRDLYDAFETATDDSDYDQNERARIIHEAEVILNMNESVDDMDKRCENCNTLLNDMGKCPKCDEGEEDLDEATLNEAPDIDRHLDKLDTRESKDIIKKAKAVNKLIKNSLKKGNRYYYKGDIIELPEYSQKVREVADILMDGSKLLKLDTSDPNYDKVRDIIDTVVIDKDGWIIKRGLEYIKPGKISYRADRLDKLEIKNGFKAEDILGKQSLAKSSTDAIDTDSNVAENPKKDDASENPKKDDTSDIPEDPHTPPEKNSDNNTVEKSDTSKESFQKALATIQSAGLKLVGLQGGAPVTLNNDQIKNLHPGLDMNKIWVSIDGKNRGKSVAEIIADLKKNNLIESIDIIDTYYDDMEIEEEYDYDNLTMDEGMSSKEWNSLLSIANDIGLETIKDLDTFSKHEVDTDETLLDAMKRYKGEVEGDIEPLEEVFSEDVINEEFTDYATIRAQFEADKMNYGQREAFDTMLNKACRSLNIDLDFALIYEDRDREVDPIYFADESKELQYNVLKLKVFDLEVVRIEFKGLIYIVFRSQADADIYMNYAH